jgi:hypothetical protein
MSAIESKFDVGSKVGKKYGPERNSNAGDTFEVRGCSPTGSVTQSAT